jgi:hypothetical protein
LKRLARKMQWNIYAALSILITFGYWCFSLIFFRASTVSDAMEIILRIVKGFLNNVNLLADYRSFFGIFGRAVRHSIIYSHSGNEFLIAFFLISGLVCMQFVERKISLKEALGRSPFLVKFAVFYSLVWALVSWGVFKNTSQFIYFRF